MATEMQNELDRIENNVNESLSAVSDAGIAVPSGATSDDLPGLISDIGKTVVRVTEQTFTDEQKAQARENLGISLEHNADVAVSQMQEQFAIGDAANEISNITEWVQATSPSGFNQRQRSCCYGNGYYIIAGTAGQMIYSTDAVTWTFVPAFTTAVITGLAYGNGRFVAVDSNGNIYSAALPTETWTLVYQNPVIIESVRYLNNQFVAVGSEGFFATSIDAINWNQYTVPTTNTLIDSAYGNGCFIAVGASGTIIRSINLIDWFDHSITGFGDIRTALFTSDGFVVGGASGNIAHSVDGANWAMATNNTTSTISWIRAFAYAEKRIYTVMYTSAGKGEIWISKDGGATWTVDKSVAGRLWCCVCGDGVFVTSGDSGAIYVLDLDIDWTDEEPSEGASIWHRYIATLSNGDKIISESYKKSELPTATQIKDGLMPATDKKKLDGVEEKATFSIPIVPMTSTDGVTYTANIEGIEELKPGMTFLFVPDKTTTSIAPTLNVNGLGACNIRRKLSMGTATGAQGGLTTMFYANRPTLLMYDNAVGSNKFWFALDFTKPCATDLYGYVKPEHGGTGLSELTAGSYLVGNGTEDVILKTPAEVKQDLGMTEETWTFTLEDGSVVTKKVCIL